MISLAEARALIHSLAIPPAPVRLPLNQARGRVLREDVMATEDLPAFDRSAMDGYALARADKSERFRVVAEIQPGPPDETLVLKPGECARVFTGAPIPQGADAVLMQEDTQRAGEWMTPRERSEESHIRHRGEDVRQGDIVLRAGTRLRPAELSLLAHLGYTEPLVAPAPRVLHVATGRELVAPHDVPRPGEIRDSNSTLLAGELAAAGAQLVGQSRCGDDLDSLVAAIGAPQTEPWQMLLISGGASVGDYDFGQRSLEQLGFTVHFTKMNLRPGKPLIFASRGPQMAFVIPGNPVSHFVLFHLVLRTALAALEGSPEELPVIHVHLTSPLGGEANPRDTYWPARLRHGPARLEAEPLRWQSSGDLSGIVGTNALLHLPGGEPPPEGTVACTLL